MKQTDKKARVILTKKNKKRKDKTNKQTNEQNRVKQKRKLLKVGRPKGDRTDGFLVFFRD